ncbi:amidohydrolase [Bacillus sp. ISL-51]|uniref:amidohydrolase n=1 Tax=unclassified Bacillus (in: firmicutes) TaxID=185979 RepID=UPI001BEB93FE|nr:MULTISPECIES: amidohydrolase [unclassified Bacillus (in: firmicutes)]MBT2574095.1 amidohydrolase [Bacillus sp. ISL-51]MBT2636046.1 amidohydrolase [Bacillus sp. ISL-26]
MKAIWHGGFIYTMLEENQVTEAVYIEDGIIRQTGSYSELIEAYGSDDTADIDLKGAVMFPGFTDSHLHLIGHGEKLLRLDLSGLTSKEAILQAAKEAERGLADGEWLIGEGWNENQFAQPNHLTKHDLDPLFPDRPVLLKRVCRHAAAVNSVALRAAGITSETSDPDGGVIARDDGEPTGLLLDKAQELVTQVLPPVSLDYVKRALQTAITDCWSKGLTGGHSEDLAYYGDVCVPVTAYESLTGSGLYPFRAHLLVHHEAADKWSQLQKSTGPYVEYGAMKIFADGALGGRTALLKKPYHDDPSVSGVQVHDDKTLSSLVKKAREKGMEIAVHAIGDLAFEKVQDAIEQHPAKPGQRDRLIHAQVLDHALIERASRLSIGLDLQPHFVASDFPWVIDRLGEERMETAFAWKTLISKGILCAGGSDAPIEPVDPILGIQSAVLRTSKQNPNGPVYNEKECLTVYEAIQLYTTGSAAIIHKENTRGAIAPGYDADFTILSGDPFTVDPKRLHELKAVKTVVSGQIVYEKEDRR